MKTIFMYKRKIKNTFKNIRISLYINSYIRLIISLEYSLIIDKRDIVYYNFGKLIPKLLNAWEKLKIE